MLVTETLTQTGLRLELVSLEMRSLVDRSVKCSLLHEVIEYCVPRRLLRSFHIGGEVAGCRWSRANRGGGPEAGAVTDTESQCPTRNSIIRTKSRVATPRIGVFE